MLRRLLFSKCRDSVLLGLAGLCLLGCKGAQDKDPSQLEPRAALPSGDDATHPKVARPVVAAYYPEWAVYGRQYGVEKIPFDQLTHLLYAFLPICGPNPSLQTANPSGWALLQQECQGKRDFEVTIHDRNAALGSMHNNFGKLAEAKKTRPGLNILVSVGGWTLSDPFYDLVKTAESRRVFIQSLVKFLEDYPFFDGVDLDWEYPGGGGANAGLGAPTDGADFVQLVRELRSALNELGTKHNRHYLTTAAVGSAPSKIDKVPYFELFRDPVQPLFDLVFAMTYDYYGAWDGVRGHQAGLYAGDSMVHSGFYGAATIDNLIKAGVPAERLVLGVAMYGRAWQNIQPQGNSPLSSSAQDNQASPWGLESGMYESGIMDYKFIASRYIKNSDFVRIFDTKAKAPFLWSATQKKLISYEDACSTGYKVDFAKQRGLAGVFAWEIDGDNGDILGAMNSAAPLNICAGL